MDGFHINFAWAWWAVALVLLQLTPPRHIETMNIVELTAPKEEVWVDVDLSDLNTFDEDFEAAFEAALEEDTAHFEAWKTKKKAEIMAILDQVEARLWADHLITMPRNNTPWLPPSLGLKA
jgi:hypothetical protein